MTVALRATTAGSGFELPPRRIPTGRQGKGGTWNAHVRSVGSSFHVHPASNPVAGTRSDGHPSAFRLPRNLVVQSQAVCRESWTETGGRDPGHGGMTTDG